MEHRASRNWLHEPMSVYEVHLGSWRRGLSYRDLATQLTEYVLEHGFTHAIGRRSQALGIDHGQGRALPQATNDANLTR